MKFSPDKTMVIRNSNYGIEMKSYYYYKDGYIFFTLAETKEEYEQEVTYINENFEEALKNPFYAYKITAFRLVAEEADGYSSVYICKQAIFLAVVGGIIQLVLIGLTCGNFVLWKKANKPYKEEQVL